MAEPIQQMCLITELDNACKLILTGFEELQKIQMDNDFYHLPQQLLSSGLERLFKCYICLVYEAKHGQYPDCNFLKNIGHDLLVLKKVLVKDYYSTNGKPLLKSDLIFLKQDSLLDEIINVLSEFGKRARYYNLDIVTNSNNLPIDPDEEWEKMEKRIEDPIAYISDNSMERLYHDYYPRVNSKIIGKLERLCRAISMQFTVGNHGGKLLEFSPILTRFRKLQESDFGTIDYRSSVIETKNKWVKRNKKDVLNSSWPSTIMTKAQFPEEWPFRADEVIVECRENLFCVVNIKDYDFALNGAAKNRFGYPDPHEAGVAILGKSVSPFTDKAFSLAR